MNGSPTRIPGTVVTGLPGTGTMLRHKPRRDRDIAAISQCMTDAGGKQKADHPRPA